MNNELSTLCKVIAIGFRKAGHWYVAYLLCQLVILTFAIGAIFIEWNPNVSALVAFLGVFASECVRWRSDYWKTQGDWAKRKWELADAFGIPVDNQEIADWVATQSTGLLKDVTYHQAEGSLFDSRQPPGPRRGVENTQESAWWSKHESRRMLFCLGFVLVIVAFLSFAFLTISITALKTAHVIQSGIVVQRVGGIICSVLVFAFSINLVRLLIEFWKFASGAERILTRCAELLRMADLTERQALSILHDYQTLRSAAPLLPSFIWEFRGDHLREQWAHFRPK